jgi:multisubunit Na+/H+ antiporter MnhG subunit
MRYVAFAVYTCDLSRVLVWLANLRMSFLILILHPLSSCVLRRASRYSSRLQRWQTFRPGRKLLSYIPQTIIRVSRDRVTSP